MTALRCPTPTRARSLLRVTAALLTVAVTGAVAQPAAAASLWVIPGTGRGQAQAQALTPPANVTATCTNPTLASTITVSWTAVAHASSYSVYQSSKSAGTGYTLAASGLTGTSWTSPSLTANNSYWFEVTVLIGTNWQSANSANTNARKINIILPVCQ